MVMEHTSEQSSLYGLIAEFDHSDDLVAAAEKVRDAGYTRTDAFSPFPVHGLDDALGVKRTILPWIVLGGGLAGCIGGFMLQVWVSVIEYPIMIGGKPFFSWPSFIPITFECTILGAGLTIITAMLAMNGLPQPYHSIFNAKNFERASQDGFFLCIEADDELFDDKATRELLESCGSKEVSEVEK